MNRQLLCNPILRRSGRGHAAEFFRSAASIAYDLYRIQEYGRRAHWQSLRALGSGTLAFWRCLGTIVKRRRLVQRTRQVSDRDLRVRGLLVPTLAAFREYRHLGQRPRPDREMTRDPS